LIELERGKRIIVRNFEGISYKRMATRLHLRTNDFNSRPFSVYVYGNTTPPSLYYSILDCVNWIYLPVSSRDSYLVVMVT